MGFIPSALAALKKLTAPKIFRVGHATAGIPSCFHALTELVDVTGPIQHGVVAMKVQMDELRHWELYRL